VSESSPTRHIIRHFGDDIHFRKRTINIKPAANPNPNSNANLYLLIITLNLTGTAAILSTGLVRTRFNFKPHAVYRTTDEWTAVKCQSQSLIYIAQKHEASLQRWVCLITF